MTELFPPSLGGQEFRFSELSEVLVERGHEVAVFTIGHEEDLPRSEFSKGISIHRYPQDPEYRHPRVPAFRRKPVTVARYALWCREVLKDSQWDAVLMNQWPLAHILAVPARSRRMVILDWCEFRMDPLLRAAQRYLPRLVGDNQAVSTALASKIASASGQTVAYMPSGVHRSAYRQKSLADRSGLLFLGRLASHKNLSLLVQAFENLAHSGFEGHLVIAGDGPEKRSMMREAETSPHRDRIEFRGLVSESEKVDLLSSSLLLVIPSRREGFPRIVAEAMASGLPTVTVDYPENGTVTVVRQFACGITTSPTPLDLAGGIKKAVSGWSTYSQKALEGAEELDWSTLVSDFEDRLRDLTVAE